MSTERNMSSWPLRESRSCTNIDISKGSMLGPDPVSDLRAGLSAESAPAELLMDRPELARDSSELRQRRWGERERLELQHPNSLLQTIGQWLAYDQWHGNKILFSVYSTSLTCHNNVMSSFLSSNDLHLKSFLHLKQILIYQLYTWPIKTLGLVRF